MVNRMNQYDFRFVSPRMLDETKKKCGESHYEEKSLMVNAIDNAYVLPCVDCWKGGIVDEKGTYYEYSYGLFPQAFSYVRYIWSNRSDHIVAKVLKRLKVKCHK